MSGLPDTYFCWRRDILASGLGITARMLRTLEEAGVLRRTDAPAFARKRVKPFVTHEVKKAFGIRS